MTPTEQDKEIIRGIEKALEKSFSHQILVLNKECRDELIQLITADRKRVALEAKIEVCDKYLGFRAASDTEHEAIQWLDFQRDELHTELKAQQEEV